MTITNRDIPVPLIAKHAALQTCPGTPGRTLIVGGYVADFKKPTVPSTIPVRGKIWIKGNCRLKKKRIIDRNVTGSYFTRLTRYSINGRNVTSFTIVFGRFEIERIVFAVLPMEISFCSL